MNDFKSPAEGFARFTENANGFSGLQLRLNARVVVDETQLKASRAVRENRGKLLSAGRGDKARALYGSLRLLGFSGAEAPDGRDARFVFVAQRKVQHEVPVGDETELSEALRKRCELFLTNDAGRPPRGALSGPGGGGFERSRAGFPRAAGRGSVGGRHDDVVVARRDEGRTAGRTSDRKSVVRAVRSSTKRRLIRYSIGKRTLIVSKVINKNYCS